MPRLDLTDAERTMLAMLVGWALDQDHDARSMGDPDYLYFLTDEEDERFATPEKALDLLNGLVEKLAGV